MNSGTISECGFCCLPAALLVVLAIAVLGYNREQALVIGVVRTGALHRILQ